MLKFMHIKHMRVKLSSSFKTKCIFNLPYLSTEKMLIIEKQEKVDLEMN